MPPQASPMDPFRILQPRPEALAWLPFGAVRPRGWLAEQMRRDLTAGFVGRLDELVPALIRDDDLYGRDRLTRKVQRKHLGVQGPETEWDVQFLWWNSETQSNWWDGCLRSALLLDLPEYRAKAAAYVDRMLATQDPDGYLGIYAPDLRFNFTGENGELWAQATLLRALLGYYEFTGERRVLEAVERAVAVVMRAYPIGLAHPFLVEKSFAGVGHGLVITDVLDRLHQLTGRAAYRAYLVWLYQEYSQSPQSQADIQYGHLRDPAYRFKDHGVHTYEHLRPLAAAVYASGNPALAQALAMYVRKLDRCLTPSGGPIGDEFIGERAATADTIGYEYCSIQELFDSYTHLLQKAGEADWAERAEWLFLNAGQGARHPQASAIAYLKTDNSYSMLGPLDPAAPPGPEGPQTRYKYSPVHQDVAVCCVPNAGRLTPYFVKAMWLRTPDGLAAALYGPCEVSTHVHAVAVRVVEETAYPFDLTVTLLVETDQPVAFELSLRRPAWAGDVLCSMPDGTALEEAAGWLRLKRTWATGDKVQLEFRTAVAVRNWGAGECYVSHGPLVYARPLPASERVTREYAPGGFNDRLYALDGQTTPRLDLALKAEAGLRLEPGAAPAANPWLSPPEISVELEDGGPEAPFPARLWPLGSTLLRQVTFPRRGRASVPQSPATASAEQAPL